MLKVLHTSGLPISLTLDPTAQFEAGMVAQNKLMGNDIVVGVSDGTAPIGIIDDTRTVAFTRPQIDEVIEIQDVPYTLNLEGKRLNAAETVGFLEYSNITEASFTSTIALTLNSVNGAIIIEQGTPLNFDFDGDSINDGFRVIVNYIYKVTSMPGEDSTSGSGKLTVHYCKGYYATDQFDTRQAYPLNATLYVGLDGKFTTKQPTENHPGIAMVTGPPSSSNGTLELLLF